MAVSDVWVVEGSDPREGGGPDRGERATLMDYLRVYRLTLELKCDGLTPEQLAPGRSRRRRCPCSAWSGTWPRSSSPGSAG